VTTTISPQERERGAAAVCVLLFFFLRVVPPGGHPKPSPPPMCIDDGFFFLTFEAERGPFLGVHVYTAFPPARERNNNQLWAGQEKKKLKPLIGPMSNGSSQLFLEVISII